MNQRRRAAVMGGPMRAWSLAAPTFVQSKDLSGTSTTCLGILFKPDGLAMYILETNVIRQYSLSTAWDISTASSVATGTISGIVSLAKDFCFKDGGAKIYVSDATNDRIFQYSLTAWDISTLSYDSVSFDTSPTENGVNGLFFTSDGLSMYFAGNSGDKVYQFSMSPAWDLSSLAFVRELSVAAKVVQPLHLRFSAQGNRMFISDGDDNRLNEYHLSTYWDISTATWVRDYSVTAKTSTLHGMTFSFDGTKIYIVGTSEDDVFQYRA